MTRYAAHTTVLVKQSRLQIEDQVIRYGATGFTHVWTKGVSTIEFTYDDRRVRFTMATDPRRHPEQEERSKWRALLLVIKGKLEAVESGILTFEESFFAHIVHPKTGRTVYQMASRALRLAHEEKGGDKPLLS